MRNVFIFHWSWCAFSFPLILVFEFFWALASVFVFMCTGPVKTLFHLLSVFVFMCTGPFKVLFHLVCDCVHVCRSFQGSLSSRLCLCSCVQVLSRLSFISCLGMMTRITSQVTSFSLCSLPTLINSNLLLSASTEKLPNRKRKI